MTNTVLGEPPRRIKAPILDQWGNTALLAVALGFGQIALGFTYAVVAVQTGPTGFGVLSTGVALSSLAVDVIDFGANSHLLRRVAQGENWLGRFFTLLIHRVAASVCVATLLICARLTSTSALISLLCLLLPYFAVVLVEGLFLSVLRGLGRQNVASVCQGLGRMFSALTALCLGWRLGHWTLVIPLGLALGTALSMTIAGILLRDDIHWQRPAPLRRTILDGRHFGVSGLMSDLQLVDTPIVTAFAGPAAAGHYGVAGRVTSVLGIPISAFATIVLQRVAADRRNQERWFFRSLRQLVAAYTGFSIMLILVVPRILPAALGQEWSAAITPLQIILAAMVLASVNHPLASFLNSIGLDRDVSRVLTVVMLANLPVLALAAHLGQATGAAVDFLLVQIALLSVLSWLTGRGRAHC